MKLGVHPGARVPCVFSCMLILRNLLHAALVFTDPLYRLKQQ